METQLKYTGYDIVYYLKRSWSQGAQVPMAELYVTLGKKYGKPFGSEFIEWVQSNYLTDRRDFEVLLGDDMALEGGTVKPGKGKRQKLTVETELAAYDNLEDAVANVSKKKNRHADVEQMPRTRNESKGKVVHGDSIQTSRRDSTLVLDETGQRVHRPQTQKEIESKVIEGMSNAKSQAKILSIDGVDHEGKPITIMEGAPSDIPKVNHKDKFMSQIGANKAQIIPEDIAFNPDVKESIRFIEMCRDKKTLEDAKSLCKNIGAQKLITKIEKRLDKLPRF